MASFLPSWMAVAATRVDVLRRCRVAPAEINEDIRVNEVRHAITLARARVDICECGSVFGSCSNVVAILPHPEEAELTHKHRLSAIPLLGTNINVRLRALFHIHILKGLEDAILVFGFDDHLNHLRDIFSPLPVSLLSHNYCVNFGPSGRLTWPFLDRFRLP